MITTYDARRHLRVDGNQDDAEIEQKLFEAIAIAASYCGIPATEPPYDLWDAIFARDTKTEAETEAAYLADKANWQARALDAGILLILGELWRCRESGTADPLSPAVKRILDMFRKPTYA